jgi:hypothetical protein
LLLPLLLLPLLLLPLLLLPLLLLPLLLLPPRPPLPLLPPLPPPLPPPSRAKVEVVMAPTARTTIKASVFFLKFIMVFLLKVKVAGFDGLLKRVIISHASKV